MKKVTYLVALIFAMVLITNSCEKDNNSESARLRISKIADNQQMEDAAIFEYSSSGLLTRVTQGSEELDVEYNDNGQPIKTNEYRDNDHTFSQVKNFNWNSEGFISADEGDSNNKTVYKLNTDGQLASKTALSRENLEAPFDTMINTVYTWIGNDSCKVTKTYNPLHFSEELVKIDYYKFRQAFSVYKGINIALIAEEVLPNDLEEIQNIHGTIKRYVSNGDIWSFNYELNPQNFPVKANSSFKNIEGTSNESFYFEYESY
jgi:hypothetical protein